MLHHQRKDSLHQRIPRGKKHPPPLQMDKAPLVIVILAIAGIAVLLEVLLKIV